MPEVLSPEQAVRLCDDMEKTLADMDAEALTLRRLILCLCGTQLLTLVVLVLMVLAP